MRFKSKPKSRKTSSTLLLALCLMLTLSASKCATTSSEPVSTCSIPPWPPAGASVADEMDRVCPTKDTETGAAINACPAINDWHARLFKFKQQLEVNL